MERQALPEPSTGSKRLNEDAAEKQTSSVKRQRRDGHPNPKSANRSKHKMSRSERSNAGQRDSRNRETQTRIARPAKEGSEESPPLPQEPRRPKKKVAVLIGYAGTGYKGMQMTPSEKTIEGDLFAGFCAAGAISAQNSDDPKKSSFVRCARTDKGVHAAGNVVSLKLIVDGEAEADLVGRINDHLPAQIRVWGVVPTVGSFSCYTQCDSRIYEYLIPAYCLLPPNPRSALARKLREAAEEHGDLEGYTKRQEGNEDFWTRLEEDELRPLLQTFDPEVQEALLGSFEDADQDALASQGDDQVAIVGHPRAEQPEIPAEPSQPHLFTRIKAARASLRAMTLDAKRRTRIASSRIERLRSVLSSYVGTHRFHNYTIKVTASDPSSVRMIKSFECSDPFPISPSKSTDHDGSPAETSSPTASSTDWLSLKVHGQSFMMHQIRKMVAMAILCVRAGSAETLIPSTIRRDSASVPVPKAPALGLLLERPVFGSYSARATEVHDRQPIDFDPYRAAIDAFKQREIYRRIFEEERSGTGRVFEAFFGYIDAFQADDFGYLASGGLEKYGKADAHNQRRREGPSEPKRAQGTAEVSAETPAAPAGPEVANDTVHDDAWQSEDGDGPQRTGEGETG